MLQVWHSFDFEKRTHPIILLSQCILDEIQIAPDLLKEGLEWIARRTEGPTEIIPPLFRGKYGRILKEVVQNTYMSSKTDGEWILKEWDEAWAGGEPHIKMMNELVDWIEDRVEHRCQAQNGRMTIEVIMAIYESARLHERVDLPLRTRVNPLDLMVDSGHLKVKYPGYYDNHAWQLFGVNTSTWSKWDGSEKG